MSHSIILYHFFIQVRSEIAEEDEEDEELNNKKAKHKQKDKYVFCCYRN